MNAFPVSLRLAPNVTTRSTFDFLANAWDESWAMATSAPTRINRL